MFNDVCLEGEMSEHGANAKSHHEHRFLNLGFYPAHALGCGLALKAHGSGGWLV